MRKLVPLLSLLTLTPAVASQLPPDCRYTDGTSTVQQIHYYLNEMERLHVEYQRARSGSWEEQRAIEGRNQAAGYAASVAQNQVLHTLSHGQMEHLHLDMHSRYLRAPSGSVAERTYIDIRNVALTAYEQKGMENIRCLYGDVRSIDLYAEAYHQMYQRASSGSRLETIAINLRNATYLQSENILHQSLRMMSGAELDSLQFHYEQEYQRAPSGSTREKRAVRMRNAIRHEISQRGVVTPPHPIPVPVPRRPNPVPPPRAHCPPGTVFDARLARCVSVHSPRR